MTERNAGISNCRIIATLFIVICHIVGFLTFIPGNQALGQFFNVGVYMFIIISGLLYGHKEISDIKSFLKKRMLRVYIPCFIWAVFVLTATLFAEPIETLYVLLNIQGASWLVDYITVSGGTYLAHTWFVTIILICYLITPLLRKISSVIKLWHIVLMFALCMGLEYVGIHLELVFLYAVSYFISAKKIDTKRVHWLICLLMFASAIGMRLIAHKFIDGTVTYDHVITPIGHSLIAWAIIIVILKATGRIKAQGKENRITKWMDEHSYTIYLVHYSIIPFLFGHINLWIALLLFAVLTVVFAVPLNLISKKIMGMIK